MRKINSRPKTTINLKKLSLITLTAGFLWTTSNLSDACPQAPRLPAVITKKQSDRADQSHLPSAGGDVVKEKIAIFPEYDFKPVKETWHATGTLSVKDAPYSSGNKVKEISTAQSLEITGRNSLDYWEAKVDGKTVYVASEDLVKSKEAVFESVDQQEFVLEDTPLYSRPDKEMKTKKKAQTRQKVKTTGRNQQGWSRIEVQGKKFYVPSELLSDDLNRIFEAVSQKRYLNTAAYLLDAPNQDGNTLATATFNSEVEVTGRNDSGYARVIFDGQKGFINEKYLSKSQSALLPESSSQPAFTGPVTDRELEIMCAVVRQEGGGSYESSLAVMSSAVNRANSSRWKYIGDSPFKQLTAPGQYSYSIDSHWVKYMGFNVPDHVIKAVKDGLAGKTNHPYTSFRSYQTPGSVCIGGNWYFG